MWSDVKSYVKQELHSTETDGRSSGIENAVLNCVDADGTEDIWCDIPDYEQLQQANKVLTTKAYADTNHTITANRKIFTDKLKKAGSFFISG